jgi:hypothetical protein
MIRRQQYRHLALCSLLLGSVGCSAVRFSLVPTIDRSRSIGMDEAVTVVQARDRVREVRLSDGQRLQLIPVVVRRVGTVPWQEVEFRILQNQKPYAACECAALGEATFETELRDSVGYYVVPLAAVEAIRAKDWVWRAEDPEEATLRPGTLSSRARTFATLSDTFFVMGIDAVSLHALNGGPVLMDSLFRGEIWGARWSAGIHRAPPRPDRAIRIASLRRKGVDSVHIAGHWHSLDDAGEWIVRPWSAASVKTTLASTDEIVEKLQSLAGGWAGVRRWEGRHLTRIRDQGEARLVLACRSELTGSIPLRPGDMATLEIKPRSAIGHEPPEAAYYPLTLDRRNGFFGIAIGLVLVLGFLVFSTS